MKLELKLSEKEASRIIVDYLKATHGFDIEPTELHWNYGSCEIGRYGGVEYPRKPKPVPDSEPEKAIPAPVGPNADASQPASPEAAPAEIVADTPF